MDRTTYCARQMEISRHYSYIIESQPGLQPFALEALKGGEMSSLAQRSSEGAGSLFPVSNHQLRGTLL
ncbi:unnamed protein product [Colias eurytheme]|nr:unnamed protein product [Colias eurytheme]